MSKKEKSKKEKEAPKKAAPKVEEKKVIAPAPAAAPSRKALTGKDKYKHLPGVYRKC